MASGEYEVCTCLSRAGLPRTAGRMGFSGCRSEHFDGKAQNQGPGKMAKYICVGAPLLIFVFFGGAPGFRQNRVFENRQIFAETTENVVPNCRGSKTHFGALGSGTSNVRNGSNMVPKYFSLNGHFLSHSPSRTRGELFYFSCLFPFLAQVPFYISHGCIVLQQLLQFVLFVVFHFCCFCWLCSFLLLVPLLLILLRHSFLSLDFCLWFFFLFSFFVFAFHVFSSCCLSYPPPASFLILCFFQWLTPILFLCVSLSFVFISYLV